MDIWFFTSNAKRYAFISENDDLYIKTEKKGKWRHFEDGSIPKWYTEFKNTFKDRDMKGCDKLLEKELKILERNECLPDNELIQSVNNELVTLNYSTGFNGCIKA